MTTLAELRTKARSFIKDSGDGVTVPQKVADEELTDYAVYAIADYSTHFPRSLVQTHSTPVTVPLDPPTDMIPQEDAVQLVEVSSAFWTEVTLREGSSLPATGNYWYWRGEQIYLSSTPEVPVYVHYNGLHDLPDQDADVITVPAANLELLVVYMAAKFHQKMGTVAAKLDRFRESGKRNDNPLVTMHDLLMQDYLDKIADRMHRGTVRIRST
jgi:hypothetical protein